MAGELHILDWFRQLPKVSVLEPRPGMATVICRGLGANVTAFRTDAGLVVCDSGSVESAPLVHRALREWAPCDPVHTIILTHGHFDHVNGVALYMEEARQAGRAMPRLIAHENTVARFRRYTQTAAHNERINRRQYSRSQFPWPTVYPQPDVLVHDSLSVAVGNARFELRHGRGETDDHLWVWNAERSAVVAGDFVIWASPNAGNPQKVQRYAAEWAQTLQAMRERRPDVVVGGHGPILDGRDVVEPYLSDTAAWLQSLHAQTVALVNAGAKLDEILHRVRPPPELADRPYLQPNYDGPEFVVRNIVRLIGGWWDGNPANLKPARDAELAGELCALAGGPQVVADRARALAAGGKFRLAGHLAEYAVLAGGGAAAHAVRAEVNAARATQEPSQMAKGIFKDAAEESQRAAQG
jgi:alkyl sulfatase BDS1-like metallo-beta-lactamase superfamily hydrolase